MIAANEDVWTAIAAPLPQGVIDWRQDGKPSQRQGAWYARFVPYIDAHFVRERLDAVAPGGWFTKLEMLQVPPRASDEAPLFAFKCTLTVLGVPREDVGEGEDPKSSATDAFKRAALRFGIAAELYDYEPNWVQVDSDSKYAKAVEDPSGAYARRYGSRGGDVPVASRPAPAMLTLPDDGPAPPPPPRAPEKTCPKCGGATYNNVNENNARVARGEKMRPDYKCKKASCDGLIWREKDDKKDTAALMRAAMATSSRTVSDDDFPPPLVDEQDDLPF